MSTTPASAESAPASEPSTLTIQDVDHLARLARLDLTAAELEIYRDQLSVILHSVAEVASVTSADILPTTHAVPLTNVFRQDVIVPGLDRESALAAAPDAQEGRFRVPQILGDEQ